MNVRSAAEGQTTSRKSKTKDMIKIKEGSPQTPFLFYIRIKKQMFLNWCSHSDKIDTTKYREDNPEFLTGRQEIWKQ